MVEDLQIKDFALIESVSLDFNAGFTVLSGETGAGKSILIGALSFLLGGKGGTEVIRTGAKEARVSGTIKLDSFSNEAKQWLSEHGIETEDERVLLRRIVKDTGKASAWIQDTPVTKAELSEFTSMLVDIHGQHEHQALMYPVFHRKYLDSYAGITEKVAAFSDLYARLLEKKKLLDDLNGSDAERARRQEMLSFAVDEIKSCKLKNGEDKELEQEEKKLAQYEKLYSDTEDSDQIFSGENSVLLQIKKLRQLIEHAAQADSGLEPLSSRIENAFYELSDISSEIKDYKNSLVFDPARLEEIQERSALLFRLKKKYASSPNAGIEEVIKYAENAEAELEKLSFGGENKARLETEVSALEKEVYANAKELSEKRKASAKEMSSSVAKILANLGMPNALFSVSVTQKPGDTEAQRCGQFGFDDVEFLISANPGSPLRPLAKIASGGELSRVMLALKTILSESDENGTMIFDEIDTGIGGEIAVSVAHHLKMLAKKRQILCITHLASIAVCADNQIKIEKNVVDGRTLTSVHLISGEERVAEIARMLSGDADSGASLQHARAMLQNG